ncbi:hypothetical protein ACI1P2_01655 [Paenibacillus sp. p-8]
MPNVFFQPEKYPFMYKEEVIGSFMIDCDHEGQYIYSLDMNREDHIPWAFKDRNGRFIPPDAGRLHHAVIKTWLEERIFPPERQNAEDLLKELGLPEYDTVAVLKKTRGAVPGNPYWIKFHPEDTYRSVVLDKWGTG